MLRLCNSLLPAFAALLCFTSAVSANAASWQQITDDTFARSNTYLGAAGNQTSVGNNWIDTAGQTWHIHGGMLEGSGTAAPKHMLLRPLSEASTEQRIVIKRQQNQNVETYGSVLRVQPDGSRYFVYQGGSALRINRVSASGVLAVMANATVPQPAAGDSVVLDASVVTTAAKPVVSVTYTDSTTGASSALSATDISSDAIAAPGQCGIDIASASTFDFRQATVYADNPSSAIATPAAVRAGALSTVLYLTGTGTSWTKSTTFTLTTSGSNGAALGNAVFVDATHFKVVLANSGSAGDALVLRDSTNHTVCDVSVTMPVIAATPSLLLDATAESVLNITGSGQTWITSPPQFKVTGLPDVSIVRTKVLDNASAQVTIKTGGSTGSITLQDANTKFASSTQLTVVHAVKVNDPNLLLSPYNWDVHGSSYADSNYAGAYLKLAFDTTSPGPISIVCDPTPNLDGALAPTNYPTIGWALNPVSTGGKWNYAQLDSSGMSVPVAVNAPAGHYELWVYVKSIRGGIDAGRWNSSCRKVRLLGIQVAPAAITTVVARRSTNAIIYGDSITQGVGTVGFSSSVNDDAMQSWVRSLADALDAEYGNIGLAAQQWAGSSSSIPAFYNAGNTPHDTFSYYEAGRSRLIAGKLSPAPNYVFVNLGTNDYPTFVTSNVISTLAGLREISGPNAAIYVILPFGGYGRSATDGIPTQFNAYLAAYPSDTKTFLLDCGTSIAPFGSLNATTANTENMYSFDGLHPKNYISMSYGAKIADLVRQTSGGSSAP